MITQNDILNIVNDAKIKDMRIDDHYVNIITDIGKLKIRHKGDISIRYVKQYESIKRGDK